MISENARAVAWESLNPRLRDRIDGLLCRRQVLAAIALVRQDDALDPPIGLHEAQHLLAERGGELDRRGLVEPEPAPPTTEQLIDTAATIAAPVVAVEAVWDGDTRGWLVRLVAVVRRPGPEHERFDEVLLTLLRDGGDLRLFNGHVPPWPESGHAIEQGQAVAQHLGVPFHFTNPEQPDIGLARWWDTQPS